MGVFERWRNRGSVDPDERSPQLGLKYKDLAVLGQLQAAGAELTKPRHVLHYLYFPSEQAAHAALARAEEIGWTAQVREPLPEYPDQWALVCEREDVVLSPELVRTSTDSFEALADDQGGEYDGWEASAD